MRAFSLVELSIVLVILGLLTGSILTGQSLIRAAELRSVSADFERYQAAVMGFRDKYMAWPGDMPDATRFWGAQAGGTADGVDATCAALATKATDAKTCNGNGDGMINGTSLASDAYERFRFWQHLANAGLVEGSYSGIAGTIDAWAALRGENVPASKLSPAMWTISYRGYHAPVQFMPANANIMGINGTYGATDGGFIFTPEEAWNIDMKLDDGSPAYGGVFHEKNGAWGTSGQCVTSDDAATARYSLTLRGKECWLLFTLH